MCSTIHNKNNYHTGHTGEPEIPVTFKKWKLHRPTVEEFERFRRLRGVCHSCSMNTTPKAATMPSLPHHPCETGHDDIVTGIVLAKPATMASLPASSL